MDPKKAAVLLAFAGIGIPFRKVAQDSKEHHKRLADEFGASEVENALQMTGPNLETAETILRERQKLSGEATVPLVRSNSSYLDIQVQYSDSSKDYLIGVTTGRYNARELIRKLSKNQLARKAKRKAAKAARKINR